MRTSALPCCRVVQLATQRFHRLLLPRHLDIARDSRQTPSLDTRIDMPCINLIVRVSVCRSAFYQRHDVFSSNTKHPSYTALTRPISNISKGQISSHSATIRHGTFTCIKKPTEQPACSTAGEQNGKIKAKFHYAILVADRFEAGRRPAASWNLAYYL